MSGKKERAKRKARAACPHVAEVGRTRDRRTLQRVKCSLCGMPNQRLVPARPKASSEPEKAAKPAGRPRPPRLDATIGYVR